MEEKESASAPPRRNRLFTQANAAWDAGDLQHAFELFTRAAKMGDTASQLDLGYFYDTGLWVKKDKKQAVKWYRRAYQQGDTGAANNIATVYRDLGDKRKMLWWFRRAAAMGDLDVLLELGKRYERGLDVVRNPAKAESFYRSVLLSKHATRDDKTEAGSRLASLHEHSAVPHEP